MPEPEDGCRRAAVLVLLYPQWFETVEDLEDPARSSRAEHSDGADSGTLLGDLYLVFTRRTHRVETHRGQISFPGGAMDPGEDPVATALREAREELGVEPRSLEVVGQLSSLFIPHSRFFVYPVVAYTRASPAFRPNEAEVAEVIQAPLAVLLDPTTRREEMRILRYGPACVPFFAVGSHKVWGATAMMLAELVAMLESKILSIADPERCDRAAIGEMSA